MVREAHKEDPLSPEEPLNDPLAGAAEDSDPGNPIEEAQTGAAGQEQAGTNDPPGDAGDHP